MKRSEINEQLKWDLSVLYKNEEEWLNDFNQIDELIKKYYELALKLTNSVEDFKAFDKIDDKLDDKLSKLTLYTHLIIAADSNDDKWQKNSGLVNSISSKYSSEFATVKDIICENVDKLLEFTKMDSEIAYLEKKLLRVKESNQYKLSKVEEIIVSKLSPASNAMQKGFMALSAQDVKFEDAVDKDGKTYPLNQALFNKYTESKDEVLRKDAYEKIYKYFKKHRNTLANGLFYQFKRWDEVAKLRGHEDALSASLFSDRSNRTVLEQLFGAVHRNHDLEFRYMDVYKKLGNFEKLNRWDMYVNVVNDEKEFSIEEQKQIALTVSKAYKRDYADVVNEMFEQNWIDWEVNEGKRGGAFSSGYQNSYKYILLNNNNNLGSLSTLVHEIGHSMHSYYAAKNNEYKYGSYTIIEAEVASTFNQLLLFDYLRTIATTNDEKKMYLIKLINNFRATVYRQTMFAEFEVKINDRVSKGDTLTAGDFESIYQGLVEQYFGDKVELDELAKFEGYRIPHFYYNFYVYKYATGLITALALYNKIKEDYEGTLEKIYEFLSAGRAFDPLEVIKKAGIDLESQADYDLAFKQFGLWIDELEKLAEQGE